MILKRVIYGVDKNPMAVELAKVALWLHTFTVGAPLSFLDHHLKCGDSLFGEWVRPVMDKIAKWGGELLINNALQRAQGSARGMATIENLTDAEIAEAKQSASLFVEVEKATAPLAAFMSLIHALEWLTVTDKDDKAAIRAWLDGVFGDPIAVAMGAEAVGTPPAEQTSFLAPAKPVQETLLGVLPRRKRDRETAERFIALSKRAKALISEENFLHWQVGFPGVWTNWESAERAGGFDAIIGNPPWDRIKLQEVEWFAARDEKIAKAETAAKRKSLIKALQDAENSLFFDYTRAAERAEATSRIARKCGEYPQLSGGDTNLNSLFIERSQELVKPKGIVGLLVPSGIASDQSSSSFFRAMVEQKRLECVIDFFNKRYDGTLFFPDVYYRFKFCAYIAGGAARHFGAMTFGFFVRDMAEIRDPNRVFSISPEDIERINPNSGTAPIFQSRRDLDITRSVYTRLPVLSDHSKERDERCFALRYVRMLDMANDSDRFLNPTKLTQISAYPIGLNIWKKGQTQFLPLYEGKMVQAYDHRASDILLAEGNLFRAGQGRALTVEEHRDPTRCPIPRYWIEASNVDWGASTRWCLALKDVTSVTNARTTIATLIPFVGAGHTLPLLMPVEKLDPTYPDSATSLLANFNSTVFDYMARQKVHNNHLAWYLMEQLPVIPSASFNHRFGKKTARAIIRDEVLALTYTAHDMAPFAKDMGYVDNKGNVLPPFKWDEEDRAHRRAKLDAVFFHLYGVTNPGDVEYVFSTFPIVEREETERWGRYLSRDLTLAYINALAAGDPDARIKL
ncbi:MAG: Eco57I restriction-modification methylase domain-containing protein [Methylocystis sp.]